MDVDTRTEMRFWSHVDLLAEGGHWLWLGAKHRGYGQFTQRWFKNDAGQWRCKTVRAHRFSHELLVGPIPPKLTIDHQCLIKACVNPQCFDVVTAVENARRANVRTVCKRGLHLLTEDNVVRRPSKPGERECRQCHNARQRQKRAAK